MGLNGSKGLTANLSKNSREVTFASRDDVTQIDSVVVPDLPSESWKRFLVGRVQWKSRLRDDSTSIVFSSSCFSLVCVRRSSVCNLGNPDVARGVKF